MTKNCFDTKLKLSYEQNYVIILQDTTLTVGKVLVENKDKQTKLECVQNL